MEEGPVRLSKVQKSIRVYTVTEDLDIENGGLREDLCPTLKRVN